MAEVISPNNGYVYIDLRSNKNNLNLLDNMFSWAEVGVVVVVMVW